MLRQLLHTNNKLYKTLTVHSCQRCPLIFMNQERSMSIMSKRNKILQSEVQRLKGYTSKQSMKKNEEIPGVMREWYQENAKEAISSTSSNSKKKVKTTEETSDNKKSNKKDIKKKSDTTTTAIVKEDKLAKKVTKKNDKEEDRKKKLKKRSSTNTTTTITTEEELPSPEMFFDEPASTEIPAVLNNEKPQINFDAFDPSIINPSTYTDIQHFTDLLDEDERKKLNAKVSIKSPPGARLLRIAVIGNPNAGKSTLINSLVGTKVSAVSSKKQTTRKNTLGVATVDEAQFVFYDTPGVISPHYRSSVSSVKEVSDPLLREAMESLEHVDVVLFMIDATKPIEEVSHLVNNIAYFHDMIQKSNTDAPETIKSEKKPTKSFKPVVSDPDDKIDEPGTPKKFQCIAVLNKKDMIPERESLKDMELALLETKVFVDVVVISALREQGIDRLKGIFYELAYEHNWLYDSVIPKMTLKERVGEIVREKLYERFNKEVPYQIGIFISKLELTKPVPDGVLIDVDLRAPTMGQRGIIIGGLPYVHKHATADLRRLFKSKNIHLSFEVNLKSARVKLDGVSDEEKQKRIEAVTKSQRQSYMARVYQKEQAKEQAEQKKKSRKISDVFGQ
jgi:GTP-binding protein Era